MIAEIRNYLKDCIKDVLPKAEAHPDANTDENIAASRYDDTYWVEISSLDSAKDGTVISDTYNINLFIANKGGRDPQDAHDLIWQAAVCVRDNIINLSRINDSGFNDASVGNIAKEDILTNQNWTRINMSIQIVVAFSME